MTHGRIIAQSFTGSSGWRPLESRDDIGPTETAPVFRRREYGVEMVQLRWSFRRPGGGATLLMTDPAPDVAPIHNRQMVVVDRSDWLAWLDLTPSGTEVLRPLPAGPSNKSDSII
jgi:putative SOS response-associated peptidase YedK